MPVLNSKTAKYLRKLAGYKNQSKTPGVLRFPGIARMVAVPVFAPRHGESRWEPVINPMTGKQQTQAVPVTKPAVYKGDGQEAKDAYRVLKKAYKDISWQFLIDQKEPT